jgi:pilus assembly protein CpaC
VKNTKHRTSKINAKGKIMKRRLIHKLMAAACIAAPMAIISAAPVQAQTVMRPANDVTLSIGRGQLVTVPGTMADVFVANEAVADVKIKSQRQLYVFGKGSGETTVYASNAAGQVIWSANVRVGSNIESVDQMLQLAMPDAKVMVTTIGQGTYLLTGTVASPEDAAEAQRLVEAFVGKGGTGGATVNVITRLKMATPLQVNLQVRFAEVSRSLVREISSNVTNRDQTGGFLFGLSRGRSPGTIATGVAGSGLTQGFPLLDASSSYGLPVGTIRLPFNPSTGQFVIPGTEYSFPTNLSSQTALSLAGKVFGVDMLAGLDLGERVGLVTTLSQPNLTALSGETADFLAGGEFPIPLSQGLGSTTIEYKKYGVSLAYTPTVLANGRISIHVRPEVSELSSQGAVQLNGFQVPALTIRRAETTIELGSGQSFMIAGLLSNNSQNSIEKTPGAGDMPIIGALFRSSNFRRGETELVIIVTPYLVNPVDASEIKLPTDGLQTPNELQRLLGNLATDGKSETLRPMPSAATGKGAKPDVSVMPPVPVADKRKSRKNDRAAAEAPAPGFNLR